MEAALDCSININGEVKLSMNSQHSCTRPVALKDDAEAHITFKSSKPSVGVVVSNKESVDRIQRRAYRLNKNEKRKKKTMQDYFFHFLFLYWMLFLQSLGEGDDDGLLCHRPAWELAGAAFMLFS